MFNYPVQQSEDQALIDGYVLALNINENEFHDEELLAQAREGKYV